MTPITVRELTKKCGVHGTPLASRPATMPPDKDIGRIYWCVLCDEAWVKERMPFLTGPTAPVRPQGGDT